MHWLVQLVVATLASVQSQAPAPAAKPRREIVGYYPNWQWYDRNRLVNPFTLDYSKYTLLNYAFLRPEASGAISLIDPWADENLLLGQHDWVNGGYLPNTSLISRAHAAGVKVLPSIGGWTLSSNFPGIAASAVRRAAFAQACVGLIQQYGFDGIDLDWEYPGYAPHGGSPQDKANFTLLLQSVRGALDALSTTTGRSYLLTSCVGAAPSHMQYVDWPQVVPLLDMINLMSYDFHGLWESVNNHNAPLRAPLVGDPTFCVDAAFRGLTVGYGVPAEKINIGLAFYGRSALGSNALFGTNNGQANTGLFWADEGTPLYYNVLQYQGQFVRHWDPVAKVPYLSGITNGTFVSYDDEQSIALKAHYIVRQRALGAIIWEVTGDYVETAPGSGVIAGTPLVTAIRDVFSDP